MSDKTSAVDAARQTKDKKVKGKKHVAMLLDESGSMDIIREATIVGCNEFIEGLRDAKNTRLWMSWFDYSPGEDVLRVKVENTKPKDVQTLTAADYRPRGTTPLYDAIALLVARMDSVVGKDDTAMIVIVSDGMNNRKIEHDAETVAEVIADRKKKGWAFLYIAANQSAEHVAAGMGLGATGESFNFAASSSGVKRSMRSASGLAATYARAGTAEMTSASAKLYTEHGGRLDNDEDNDDKPASGL